MRENRVPTACRRQFYFSGIVAGCALGQMLGGKKILFLRNEAKKSFEINSRVVRQGETNPLNAKNKATNWSQEVFWESATAGTSDIGTSDK